MEKMNKKDLKIVFFGTPEFAVESLDALLTGGFNVVGVVTMPDKAAGRGHKLYQSDVKRYALEHDLFLLQPEKLKSEEFLTAPESHPDPSRSDQTTLPVDSLHAHLHPKGFQQARLSYLHFVGRNRSSLYCC